MTPTATLTSCGGFALRQCGKQTCIDAQRAPVRSSSCGALLRLCEAICDYADCLCELTPAWPSRALSQENIKLSAATFRPGRHFRLSRRRDPARVGVSHTVQVESSLLHCSGIDELSNEGTFRFRPTSCEQRQKHSNDPLPPRMCQFLFAKFYSSVDVSNSAQTSPWIGCSGKSWSHTLGTSTVKVRLRRWGGLAPPFITGQKRPPINSRASSGGRFLLSAAYQLISRIRAWASP